MNSHKALNVVLGFMVIAGIGSGYWLCASHANFIFENMTFLLNSERNTDLALNIRALEQLRENHIEDTVQLMEMRIKNALKFDGISAAILDCAKEYQRKYCKTACLGIP